MNSYVEQSSLVEHDVRGGMSLGKLPWISCRNDQFKKDLMHLVFKYKAVNAYINTTDIEIIIQRHKTDLHSNKKKMVTQHQNLWTLSPKIQLCSYAKRLQSTCAHMHRHKHAYTCTPTVNLFIPIWWGGRVGDIWKPLQKELLKLWKENRYVLRITGKSGHCWV